MDVVQSFAMTRLLCVEVLVLLKEKEKKEEAALTQ